MAFPPITPAQVFQLGVAAQAVGSAASTTFAALLKTATQLLSTVTEAAKPPEQSGGDRKPSTGIGGDLAVLTAQIQSLLRMFHSAVQQRLQEGGFSLPPGGATVYQNADGRIVLEGQSSGRPFLQHLLEGDESLPELFRSIQARRGLLQSVSARRGEGSSLRIRVTAGGALIENPAG